MSRYLEKDFLCSYDLSDDFFDKIGLIIKEVQPLRKVFLLKTNMGDKILKKVYYDQNKIDFIECSLNYINKTFKNTMNINKMPNGNSYLKWNDEFYIVMDKLQGIEATCTNPLDVEICARTVGEMHSASKGVRKYLEENNKMVIKSENLIKTYEEAKKDLENTKELVKGYKYLNEFDKIFLENVDRYIKEVTSALDLLKKSNYESMLENEELLAICHNDLAHHNFLIENGECKIIDFDYASINLRCIDVSDIILKWIKNSTFDIDKANLILENYNLVEPLNEDEKNIIKITLAFPRDIYSIIRVYYHKEKRWEYESYLSRFKMKIENDIYRKNFLNKFIK